MAPVPTARDCEATALRDVVIARVVPQVSASASDPPLSVRTSASTGGRTRARRRTDQAITVELLVAGYRPGRLDRDLAARLRLDDVPSPRTLLRARRSARRRAVAPGPAVDPRPTLQFRHGPRSQTHDRTPRAPAVAPRGRRALRRDECRSAGHGVLPGDDVARGERAVPRADGGRVGPRRVRPMGRRAAAGRSMARDDRLGSADIRRG